MKKLLENWRKVIEESLHLEEEDEQYQASDREDRKEDAEELGIDLEEKKKKKDDRCTRIAKRKYDVWPSAYASGAVVKCRQGKIWKGVSESRIKEIIEEEFESFLQEKEKEGLHKCFYRKDGKVK